VNLRYNATATPPCVRGRCRRRGAVAGAVAGRRQLDSGRLLWRGARLPQQSRRAGQLSQRRL